MTPDMSYTKIKAIGKIHLALWSFDTFETLNLLNL